MLIVDGLKRIDRAQLDQVETWESRRPFLELIYIFLSNFLDKNINGILLIITHTQSFYLYFQFFIPKKTSINLYFISLFN